MYKNIKYKTYILQKVDDFELSIWGKIIGGGSGLLLGGPLGAVLGFAVGHGIDKIRKADNFLLNKDTLKNNLQYGDNDKQTAFAVGVIVLAAKLSKADGKVTEEEIDTFRSVFDFDDEDQIAIGKIYNEAKENAEGFEVYAEQLVKVFGKQKGLYVELINSLYRIAFADGVLHPNEEKMIYKISSIFGMPENLVQGIRAQYLSKDNKNLDRDYKLLGVKENVSNQILKKNYHDLVRKYHPDQLVSKGLPEEFIRLANERLSEINDSYDRITEHRKKQSN